MKHLMTPPLLFEVETKVLNVESRIDGHSTMLSQLTSHLANIFAKLKGIDNTSESIKYRVSNLETDIASLKEASRRIEEKQDKILLALSKIVGE